MTLTEEELTVAYRRFARQQMTGNELEVDEFAKVSIGDNGAWVASWVWVPREEVEPGWDEDEDDEDAPGWEPARQVRPE